MDSFAELDVRETNTLVTDCNERVWQVIASLAAMFGDRRRAVLSNEAVLRHNPLSYSALKSLGIASLKRKRYDRAIGFFEKCILMQPTDTACKKHLLMCFIFREDYERGHKLFESQTISVADFNEPDFLFTVGLFYERAGESELAEHAYSSAIYIRRPCTKRAESCVRLALLLQRRRLFSHAYDLLMHALSLPAQDCNKEKIRLELAQNCFFRGTLEEAGVFLEDVDKTDSSPRAIRIRGLLNTQLAAKAGEKEKKKLLEEAHRCFEKALQLNEGDALAHHGRGQAFLCDGRQQEGLEEMKKAIERDPQNPGLWDSASKIYIQMKKYHEALITYGRLLQIWPYEAGVWHNIAVLYEIYGQKGDALDAYRRALELVPEDDEVSQRIASLKKEKDGKLDGKVPVQREIAPAVFTRRAPGYYLALQ